MHKTLSLLALLLTTVLAGCGESGPPKYPISGKVTLDGEAVEGAVITMLPAGGEPSSAAAAKSKADGSFTAKAEAGNYKIKVSKIDALDGGMGPGGAGAGQAQPAQKMTEEEELAAMEAAYTDADAQPQGREEKAKNQLPEKYNDFGSSGLTATVTANGPNEVNLELTK